MTIIVEERLVFEFGPSWEVVKYDEHPVHKRGIGDLQGQIVCDRCSGKMICEGCGRELGRGTKAVDILGSHEGTLHFIEIKDFRGHRIENRRRLHDGDLAVEVALKVRDTLAGLVGTIHARDPEEWRVWATSMFKRKPKVFLWIEQDLAADEDRRRGRPPLPLVDMLDKKLRWLGPHVMVGDRRTPRPLPDLTVNNLSDRVFAVRTLIKGKKQTDGMTSDEYARAMDIPPDVAREHTAKLCAQGVLKRMGSDGGRFIAGPQWDQFHEEPA